MLWKSRLEEYRSLLSKEDLNLVFLSETFWKPSFTVMFASYQIFKKDMVSRHGGGVALLGKNSLQAHAIPPLASSTLEVTGTQIATNSGPVNYFSVYSPQRRLHHKSFIFC